MLPSPIFRAMFSAASKLCVFALCEHLWYTTGRGASCWQEAGRIPINAYL